MSARGSVSVKREPLPDDAGHRDVAAHQARQAAGDRKPQARASLPARQRLIDLNELLEDTPELGLGDADPRVRHMYGDHGVARARPSRAPCPRR